MKVEEPGYVSFEYVAEQLGPRTLKHALEEKGTHAISVFGA